MSYTILNENDNITIYAKGSDGWYPIEFTIGTAIGNRGANVVCYEARQQNKKGVLKEFCPRKYAFLTRTDEGELRVSPEKIGTEEHRAFVQEREAYLEAHERLQRIQNEEAYTGIGAFIPQIDIFRGSRDPDDTAAAAYLFLQGPQSMSFEDICNNSRITMYADGGPRSCLVNLLTAVRALAQAVGFLHDNGLLFTDIKPDNIGFVTTGSRKEGYLPDRLQILDLDAICPMIRDGGTPERTTEGFYDPMIAYGATKQTDLYAIGATLFHAVIYTEETKDANGYDGKYYNRLGELVEQSLLIGGTPGNCSAEVQNQITAILKRCLCDNSDPGRSDRYHSCDQLCRDLERVLGILRSGDDVRRVEVITSRTDPKADYRLQTKRFQVLPGFCGRKKEIAMMEVLLLRRQIGVLFLHGIGGIGKSELAKHYALKHREHPRQKGQDYTYQQIVFMTYSESLCSTISGQLNIKGLIRRKEESDESFFRRKMDILPDITDDNTLFIIDNYDVEDDPDLEALLNGGDYTVILTTRRPHPLYETLEIGPIGDIRTPDGMQKVLEAFERHCYGENGSSRLSDADRGCVEELIRLAEGHTYAIELLAKKMRTDSLSGQELLEEYRRGLRNQWGGDVVGYKGRMQPFAHICAVFDVSHIREEEQQVLRELSLLDLQGISVDLLREWTQHPADSPERSRKGHPTLMDSINALQARGLVRKEGAYGKTVSIHPLVREVVYAKLKPSMDNCSQFLERIGRRLYDSWGIKDEENQPLKEHVQALARYFAPFDGDHILIWNSFGNFLWQVGDFDNAVKYETALYDTCLSIYGEASVHTGFVAKVLAECYHNSRRDEEAFQCYKQAEQSMRASGAGDNDELAWICERLAMCYTEGYERDLEKALAYALEAAAIRKRLQERLSAGEKVWRYEEEWEPCDMNMVTRGVALAYQEAARAYMEMQNYSEALAYADEAVRIMEEEVERGSMSEPVRAYAYIQQGLSHYHLGIEQQKRGNNDLGQEELEQSSEILGQILTVQEEYLGADSSTVLSTKESLGKVYEAMGNWEEALRYYRDVEDVMERYFPKDPQLSTIREKIQVMASDQLT